MSVEESHITTATSRSSDNSGHQILASYLVLLVVLILDLAVNGFKLATRHHIGRYRLNDVPPNIHITVKGQCLHFF